MHRMVRSLLQLFEHLHLSLEVAVEGAVEKLESVLEHTLGRLKDKRAKLQGSAADVPDLLREQDEP